MANSLIDVLVFNMSESTVCGGACMVYRFLGVHQNQFLKFRSDLAGTGKKFWLEPIY